MSILARIRAHGGEVVRDRWTIRLRPGRLDQKATAWIGRNKAALMAEIWPEHDAFEERAAIMEFDAGMTREAAEAAAYASVMRGKC